MSMRLMIASLVVLVGGTSAQAQVYYAQPVQYYAPPQYVQPQYAQQPQYYAPPPQPYVQQQQVPQSRAKQQQIRQHAVQQRQGQQAQAYAPQQVYAAQPQMVVVAQPQRAQVDRGGGFIEAIFGGGGNSERLRGYAPLPHEQQQQEYYAPPQANYGNQAPMQQIYASTGPITAQPMRPQEYAINPIYEKQEVVYTGKEEAGTIVVDTPNKFLYLVLGDGRALRYGIGVGRPGFTWAGTHNVTAKKEWPDWIPPKEMLERQPYLPKHMEGGPNNPLGARAMYLGSTLYRIHGSNEPWTIGTNVSSGCIRMRNADVEDLYERVKVGTKVIVM